MLKFAETADAEDSDSLEECKPHQPAPSYPTRSGGVAIVRSSLRVRFEVTDLIDSESEIRFASESFRRSDAQGGPRGSQSKPRPAADTALAR